MWCLDLVGVGFAKCEKPGNGLSVPRRSFRRLSSGLPVCSHAGQGKGNQADSVDPNKERKAEFAAENALKTGALIAIYIGIFIRQRKGYRRLFFLIDVSELPAGIVLQINPRRAKKGSGAVPVKLDGIIIVPANNFIVQRDAFR